MIAGGAVGAAGIGVAIAARVEIGSVAAYDRVAAERRAKLPEAAELPELVRCATLAANSHNTQPWRFRRVGAGVAIMPDLTRRTPVVDPDDHHLFASLGCAAENLSLAAASSGRTGDVVFDPADGGSVFVDLKPARTLRTDLVEAVPFRQSTRANYDGRQATSTELDILRRDAEAIPDVALALVTERAAMNRLRDLIIAASTVQMADPAFVAELKRWVRFNPREALRSGDGLYAAASGNPILPRWLGAPAFDLVFRTRAENDKYAGQIDSAAGLAVFVAASDTPAGWVAAGRACQRFALRATVLGLKTSFVNPPVEIKRFRPELAAAIDMKGQRPDLLLRFGHGQALPFSPRRPVAEVLDR